MGDGQADGAIWRVDFGPLWITSGCLVCDQSRLRCGSERGGGWIEAGQVGEGKRQFRQADWGGSVSGGLNPMLSMDDGWVLFEWKLFKRCDVVLREV